MSVTARRPPKKPPARRSAPKPMGIRAFARHLKVSHTAVQRAAREGRLPTGAKQVRGRWTIVDAERAAREWALYTRPWVGANSRRDTAAGPNGSRGGLAVIAERERTAKTKLLELEYSKKARELVPARDVEVRWTARIVTARTKLLGLPSRAKQRLPHLTVSDLAELEAIVRESLEELADQGGSGVDGAAR